MTNSKKSIIIANGEFVYNDRIKNLLESADRIVCADGGANHLIDKDIIPDLIIGDFDSIHPDTLQHFKDVKTNNITDQLSTDMMKAINYEFSHGSEEIILLGATGGRIDHTLANLSLLSQYADSINISLIDEHSEIEFVKSSITFDSIIGRKISLMTIEGNSSLTTHGLKWEFSGESKKFSPFGISNEVVSSPVTIKVKGNGIYLFKLFELGDGTMINE